MLVTCFSTARSETTNASAIAAFERPSAISSSTSRSRGGERARAGRPSRWRPTRCETTSGSSADPPPATRCDRVDEALDVGDAVLQQVADAGRVVGQQRLRVVGLDVLGQDQHAQVGVLGAQLDRRAQAVVGVVGRHAHVDDRDVGLVGADLAHEVVGVARLRRRRRSPRPRAGARRPRAAAPSRRRRLRARDLRPHDRAAAARASRPRAGRRARPAGRPARSGRCRAPGRRRRRRRRAPRPPRGRCGARRRRSRASPARTWRRSSAPRRRRSRRPPRPARAAARSARSSTSTGSGARAGQRAQRRLEPAVGEHGRVDAAGELAQLGERLVELLHRARRASACAASGSLPALVARQPQLQAQRDEPLLRAVVQVALEPAALGQARPRRSARARRSAPRPARAARRRAARSRAPARPRRRPPATSSRLLVEHGVVDDRGDAAAVVLDRVTARRAARPRAARSAGRRGRRRCLRSGSQ